MALVLVVAMCVVAGTVAGDESRSPLQFDRNGRFRILQLTDLHFGEAPDKAWGPLQDVMSMQNMVALIEMERPDLVVLSGDQVTGNNINGNATAYHGQIVRVLERHGVKWALVFGNHDDAPLEGHVVGERFPTTTRAELMRFDRTFRGSYSQFGPSSVRGVSNYLLPIADSKGATRAVLYMLDSGGGSLDIAVDYSQVDWFESASRRQGLQAAPGLLFLHVPLPIVRRVWNEERWRCEGFKDDGIDVIRDDRGARSLISAIFRLQSIRGVIYGHDHGNDMCCRVKQTDFCFGRHSGYGGYGNWTRGGRVIQLSLSDDPRTGWTGSTWIRMENGTTTGERQLPGQYALQHDNRADVSA
ncbi:hypothetical protein PBRA_000053 [Plasmodiophora brassicae]|uniref:Calcineurin-like phosphoesterase domain-containing protein n=1 Tax=Plasmodiophora brassicae TaxID=37360 RepID=A0A0G4IGG0_PLABS|nr:hypothetical protein PBRA_000053 [Plasmodiophora brassicae]